MTMQATDDGWEQMAAAVGAPNGWHLEGYKAAVEWV
jgi:hypothetical protein